MYLSDRKAITRTLACAALGTWMAWCGPARAASSPILRIPKMNTPPTIDGAIGEGEWTQASAVTGFSSVTSPFTQQQMPADMRAVWYLGYDDQHLYIAMHLPVPDGVTLNAQTKNPEDLDYENKIIFGDHVEIQMTPHSAQRAMQTGYGFYKFTVNPFDIWSDYWHRTDEPGNESAWSSGARVKSKWDLGNWWLEMAIPIVGTMKHPEGGLIEQADGLEMLMHLVNAGSCGGYSWAGWVPATWQNWDRFYRVVLDPEAPVMQFIDTGELVDGRLDLKVRMRDTASADTQPGAAKVSVLVLDAAGNEVFAKSEPIALSEDWSDVRFREPALTVPLWSDDVSKERNHVLLRVEAGERTVYTADLPFVKQSPKLRELTYENYVNTLPKGDYQTQISYIVRNGKLRVTVDTDVMGDIPKDVRESKTFRVRVQPADGGDVRLDETLAITDGVGSHLLELGKVEGEYTVVIDLLGDDGRTVSTREHTFTRVRHEWEDNTIGEERVVIPPFRPIEYGDTGLSTLLARIELDEGGLWKALKVQEYDLLTAPMRMEVSVNGATSSWQGEAMDVERGQGRAFPPEYDRYRFLERSAPVIPFDELPETDGYEAIVKGRGRVGPVRVDVESTLEYDGLSRFTIRYAPAGDPVEIERLEIVLDLFEGINGMFAAREVGGAGFMTFAPDREGTLWESASMRGRHPRFKGTFMPMLHLGDGRYGLQFRAVSDEGWLLDDDVSCMRIERVDGAVRLRLLLVNAPATLAETREVTFALMPLPAKPAPRDARYFMWGAPDRDYVHSATGWRKYGTGADNWYLPSDEAYIRLGESMRSDGKAAGRRVDPELAATKPVMMYTSPLAVGGPLPDCDSFKGQWYKDSEYDPGAGAVVQGGGKYMDPTGTYQWDRPECFSEARPRGGWDEDLNDNYMFYHRKLRVLTQTHGAYWDNAEIQHDLNLDAGTRGYVRDDGHEQPTNNSDQRRSLMKRLYTMSWLEGYPPLHNSKWPFQTPFHTFQYMWEGNWYLYSGEGSFFDAHGHDMAQLRFFRDSIETPAMINAKIPGLPNRQLDRRGPRSYYALAILHDIAIANITPERSPLLHKLDETIGFLHREQPAEFIPYWDSDELVGFVRWETPPGQYYVRHWEDWKPAHLHVSVYRSRLEPTRSVLWIVNCAEERIVTGLRFSSETLAGAPRSNVVLRDLESGHLLSRGLPKTVTREQDLETLWLPFLVPARDFVALLVEEGEYERPPTERWP